MFWLQLYLVSSAIATIIDVPHELISLNILGSLLPLSIMQFGRTCKLFYKLAQDSMLHTHKILNAQGDQLIYDVERLHDIYNEGPHDEIEAHALQRLILKKLPLPKNGYESDWYRKYKNALFLRENVDFSRIHISGQYIELCRMIIKHKKFFQHDGSGVWKDKYIDLALQQRTVFPKLAAWRLIATRAEPYAARRLASCIFSPSPTLKLIIDDPSLIAISEAGYPLNASELYLICTMTTQDNYQRALTLLKKHANDNLSEFLIVMIKYGSASLNASILKKIDLRSQQIDLAVLLISNDYAPFKLYSVLRGRRKTSKIFRFLESYDPISKEIAQVKTDLDFKVVLEAAIIFFRNDDLIETLINNFEVTPSWYHLFLACTQPISTRLELLLLSKLDDFDYKFAGHSNRHFLLPTRYHLTPAIMTEIILNFQSDFNNNDLEEILLITANLNFDLIKPGLSLLEGRFKDDFVKVFTSCISRFKNPVLEVQKIVKYCIKHNIHFRSPPKSFFNVMVDAFGQHPTKALLDYIPSVLGRSAKADRTGFHPTSFYAIAALLKRTNGPDLVEKHLQNRSDFYFVRILFDYESVDFNQFFLEALGFNDFNCWCTSLRNYHEMFDQLISDALYASHSHLAKPGAAKLVEILLGYSSETSTSYLAGLDAKGLKHVIFQSPYIAFLAACSRQICLSIKEFELKDTLISSLSNFKSYGRQALHQARTNVKDVFDLSIDDIVVK